MSTATEVIPPKGTFELRDWLKAEHDRLHWLAEQQRIELDRRKDLLGDRLNEIDVLNALVAHQRCELDSLMRTIAERGTDIVSQLRDRVNRLEIEREQLFETIGRYDEIAESAVIRLESGVVCSTLLKRLSVLRASVPLKVTIEVKASTQITEINHVESHEKAN